MGYMKESYVGELQTSWCDGLAQYVCRFWPRRDQDDEQVLDKKIETV